MKILNSNSKKHVSTTVRRRAMPSSLQIQRINPSEMPGPTAAAACRRKPQLPEMVALPEPWARYHAHEAGLGQCCSVVVQTIAAPVADVWSVLRRFDNPHAYKNFLKSCNIIDGDGQVGTLREVRLITGLPAESSTERLEILDDERHVMSFSIVGGNHRLSNYRSVTTLHPSPSASGGGTVAVESYIVDVPPGNTKEETRIFIDTIVRCNLQSLARISQKLADGE
ncbi:hypothetical protein SAY87_025976 [Trapa incisa]|uniref:Abscisic acid receptor PYL4 n=1 Tax=Trapa incisa TaxID=236973 RepID=A0AAN7GYX7_9MYRT|nr:hypothetical protein SAY87_025976 [Trapa incisa]